MSALKNEALLTDLYELTMLAAYVEHHMRAIASFEFSVRDLPPERNFLIACGQQQVCEYLENLHFSGEDIDWLKSSKRFSPAFLNILREFRFTGDVDAVPEGTIMFGHQPILRVSAPLPEAQLIESRLINLMHYQTAVASKACRSRLAAPRAQLVDFGLRRAHGSEAALLAARASYLAGFDGSSNVLAGKQFGIPIFGTMAHSFIEACPSESEAFLRYAATPPHPHPITFLIDTYDTEKGAQHVVALMPKLRAQGIEVHAVRIDSGNLAKHARAVRTILDEGGCPEISIFASGNLDEYGIEHLVSVGAPIDGFGVGTRLTTCSDAPYLDCAYKLTEYDGIPRRKRSPGKITWPGNKQIFRRIDSMGRPCGDRIVHLGEIDSSDQTIDATPLIRPLMRAGKRICEPEPLSWVRQRIQKAVAVLPPELKNLHQKSVYPVEVSSGLLALSAQFEHAPIGGGVS